MPSTYSAGSVSFLGSGNVDVISTQAGAIVFSGSQSTHSHSTSPAAISASDHLYTSGTVVLSGGSNVTVSTNGQTVFFDAAAGTATAAGGVAVSASNALYTSGTVVFTGTNGITVNTSGTGTQQTVGISGHNHGAIVASDATFTSGTVVFSGSTNVTVLTSGTGTQQTILFSAPNPGAGGATAISGIIASDATYTSGTVEFVGSDAITVKSGTGQRVIIDMTQSTHAHSAFVLSDSNGLTWGTNASTVTGSYSQSTHSHSTGPSAISASNTAFTSGTVVFTGTGGWVTVNTSGTGTQQTIGISVSTHSHAADNSIALSASDAVFTSGTVVFSGNGLTVNTSGTGTQQTIGFLASTHSHSTGPSAISASDAAFTSGTVVFSGTGGWVTVNTSGTGTQQTVGISVSTHSHSAESAISQLNPLGNTTGTTGNLTNGTIGLAGGEGITISQSSGTASTNLTFFGNTFANSNGVTFGKNAGTITASVAAAGALGAISASNTAFTSGTVVFTGTGGWVTLNTSGTGTQQTIGVSVSTHSHSAESAISQLNPLGNTTGTTGNLTNGTIGLAAGDNITLSQSSGTASTNFTFHGPTFSNSNNVTFGTNGRTVTASASYSQSTAPSAISASDKAFTSGTVVFSGTRGITVNTSGTGTQQTVGISGHEHGAIIGSDATFTSGTVVFSGGGQITVNTSGTGTQQTIGIKGNTFSNSNGVTFGTNAGTVTASIDPGLVKQIEIGTGWTSTAKAMLTGQSMSVVPFYLPGNMSAQTMRFLASLATSSFVLSSVSLSWGLAYYTKANATALSQVASTSWNSTFSATNTAVQSDYSGQRIWTATLSWNLTPGQYYLGAWWRSSGPGTFTLLHLTKQNLGLGYAGTASNSTQQGFVRWMGYRTNGTTADFPSQIAESEVWYATASNHIPWVVLEGTQ